VGSPLVYEAVDAPLETGRFQVSILENVGLVAIGRNEGERLTRCFASVPKEIGALVYVDSGSTDGSVERAYSRGAHVVELDMSTPFTAARARNAGFERLCAIGPTIEKVQFVDGDCTLAQGWLAKAAETLDGHPKIGAVCGRRRELQRDATVYNTLCDIEWGQTPPGDTDSFGGDVMVRVEVLKRVNGYNPRVIAGEEPELSFRIRQLGYAIRRIDADMTFHDADIHSFKQWWLRSLRAGYAYAQVSSLHGHSAERFWMRDRRRAVCWGTVVPLAIPLLVGPTPGISLLLLGAYPLRGWRIARRAVREQGLTDADARLWAINCLGASFPQSVGIMKFHLERIRGIDPTIIEYKE
jgi:glycosyltransferase involved in cell wall biosynthesis